MKMTPVTRGSTEKSEETPELSTVHRPLGTRGLWGDPKAQLPAYIQNIAHALIRDGHDESRAIAMAVASVKRWARGGGHVTPEVRAAAGKAVAEWEELKATHSKTKYLGSPEVVKVGPHGFIHGWVFVGVPGVGDKVRLHGKEGTVTGGDGKHAHVKFGNEIQKIPHDRGESGGGKVHLVRSDKPLPKPEKAKENGKTDHPDNEVLFHGSKQEYKPGDLIDPEHAREGVRRLHGGAYAFASTNPGEAGFFGGREHHLYRVEPVKDYEMDPHMHEGTSRRSAHGFRVVKEVEPWTGKKKLRPFNSKDMTPDERRVYLKSGKLPKDMAPPPKRS